MWGKKGRILPENRKEGCNLREKRRESSCFRGKRSSLLDRLKGEGSSPRFREQSSGKEKKGTPGGRPRDLSKGDRHRHVRNRRKGLAARRKSAGGRKEEAATSRKRDRLASDAKKRKESNCISTKSGIGRKIPLGESSSREKENLFRQKRKKKKERAEPPGFKENEPSRKKEKRA